MLDIPPDQSVAIIADTHANLTALEAVLADIDARGIKHIVHLGDVGGKGPRPVRFLNCYSSVTSQSFSATGMICSPDACNPIF
jgi:hypothetical protein